MLKGHGTRKRKALPSFPKGRGESKPRVASQVFVIWQRESLCAAPIFQSPKAKMKKKVKESSKCALARITTKMLKQFQTRVRFRWRKRGPFSARERGKAELLSGQAKKSTPSLHKKPRLSRASLHKASCPRFRAFRAPKHAKSLVPAATAQSRSVSSENISLHTPTLRATPHLALRIRERFQSAAANRELQLGKTSTRDCGKASTPTPTS